MSSRTRRLAERAVALALGLVLLRSAAAHAGNGHHFLSTVYSYQIAGAEAGRLAAASLPAVQMALAVCLVFGWFLRGAYLAAAVLFAGFAAAQSSALGRGLDISCGCFGAGDSLPVGPATLAVAGGCLLASLAGLFLTRNPAQPNPGVQSCGATDAAGSR